MLLSLNTNICRRADIIQEGDVVIFYFSQRNVYAFQLRKGDQAHTRYGSFYHSDAIGLRYGTRLEPYRRLPSNHSVAAFLLRMTPEWWTLTLPHRTQIVYSPDVSFISTYLDLRPGHWMIECGTGSGSMTHGLARTLAPHGKLFTFEYHEQRAAQAKQEIRDHGLDSVVISSHRDVYTDGFELTLPKMGEEENEITTLGSIDAIFLDLPEPWKAIPHCPKLFRRTGLGRLCSFSPCMEQVQRTCEVLTQFGFKDVVMFEVHEREWSPQYVQLRQVQDLIQPSLTSKEQKMKMTGRGKHSPCSVDKQEEKDTEQHPLKRVRLSDNADVEEKEEVGGDYCAKDETGKDLQNDFIAVEGNYLVAKTAKEMKGHTAYLTFASYFHPSLLQRE